MITILFKTKELIMKKLYIITLVSILLGLQGCGEFVEPDRTNELNRESVIGNARFAEGVLLKAYLNLQSEYKFLSDLASDDAVANDPSNASIALATGGWTAANKTLSQWNTSYEAIAYINYFLSIVDLVKWTNNPQPILRNNSLAKDSVLTEIAPGVFKKIFTDLPAKDYLRRNVIADSTINALFKKRLKAEAYGLRAWFEFQLLQAHGGVGQNNELLGFSIITKEGDKTTVARASFKECYDQIITDCNYAIANLPTSYTPKPTNTIQGFACNWARSCRTSNLFPIKIPCNTSQYPSQNRPSILLNVFLHIQLHWCF